MGVPTFSSYLPGFVAPMVSHLNCALITLGTGCFLESPCNLIRKIYGGLTDVAQAVEKA